MIFHRSTLSLLGKLRKLVLRDCAAISAAALPHLTSLRELEVLDIAGCEALLPSVHVLQTAGGAEELSSAAARSAAVADAARGSSTLRTLTLYGCTYLNESDEQALVEAGCLERVSCGCSRCSGFASAQIRLRLALMAAQQQQAMGQDGAEG